MLFCLRWRGIALLLAGCALPLAGCNQSGAAADHGAPPTSAPAAPVIPVKVEPARRAALPLRIPLVGTLYPAEEVTVATKVPGVLRHTYVDVGQTVQPGAALTQVDTADYELAVARAEAALSEALARLGATDVPGAEFDLNSVSSVVRATATLENARFTYERLVAMGTAVSDQELSDASARLRVAEADHEIAVDEAAALVALARERDAQLRAARKTLHDAETSAPQIPSTLGAHGADHWNVAARLVTEGQYLDTADPLYRLVISDPLKLRSQIPERYAADVQLGQAVVLEPLDSVRELRGVITRISPVVDPATRTFEIEALLPNAADTIKPGAFARGAIDTVAARPVVTVPSGAIVRTGGVTRLFVYTDGVARQREVQLGRQAEGLVETLAGVQEGEQVITEGAAALIDGTPVTIGPTRS